VLEERGLDHAGIGVVGLESKGPAEMEGIISYKTWSQVLEHLPRARFVDVSRQFAELMLVKSEEELALVRFSAAIGERACEAMMKVTKPGASETDIYAAVMHVIHSHGAISVAPHFILSTGPDHLGWSAPLWTYWGGRPRAVQPGDLVQAEIFPCYGGVETQQQMAIALPPVTSLHEELARVARRAYEAGLKTLRPGVTFQEVCDAMEAPLAEAECWHLTPLIHSLTPTAYVSYIGMGILERLPGIDRYKGIRTIPPLGGDLTIKPGMVFELEPNACRGNHRVNIGGAVIVTEHGVEELNRLPTEMRII
jgi:Xaa-Pro aminopeptidase